MHVFLTRAIKKSQLHHRSTTHYINHTNLSSALAMSTPVATSSTAPAIPAASLTSVTHDVTWRPSVPSGHTHYSWHGHSHGHSHAHHSTHHPHHPPHSAGVHTSSTSSIASALGNGASSSHTSTHDSNSAAGKKPHPHQHPPAKGASKPNHPSHSAAASSGKSTKVAPPPSASAVAVKPSLLHHPQFLSIHLIDIGANLSDDMFAGLYQGRQKHASDLVQVVARARARGVERIIVTAGSGKEAEHVQDIIDGLKQQPAEVTKDFPQLYSTVGVHPCRSKEWNGDAHHQQKYYQNLLKSLDRGLTSTPRTVIAIGECGLDYDRLYHSDKKSQLAHFEKHFQLVEDVYAKYKIHLPLFLHDRNTEGDFLAIMKKNRARFQHGVVHSFTGSIEDLKVHLSLDLFIGINGCSLKTQQNLDALNHIPLNRLLLETDAPWCSINNTHASAALVSPDSKLPSVTRPEQFKAGLGVKGRNEPGNMVSIRHHSAIQVLEVVSAHLGHDPIELAEIVHRNTLQVFFPEEFQRLQQQPSPVTDKTGASSSSSTTNL